MDYHLTEGDYLLSPHKLLLTNFYTQRLYFPIYQKGTSLQQL